MWSDSGTFLILGVKSRAGKAEEVRVILVAALHLTSYIGKRDK